MRTAPSPRRHPAAGYNMVMLMVAITVLNIMVAMALPMWSQEIQRDREEELISRGWQYVEAIRVFQNRFQRMPVRLEELIEVKPRSIRKLWKDPMTDGKMQPVFQNEGQPLTAQPDPKNPQGLNPADPKDPNGPPPDDPNLQPDANGNKPQIAAGPITGVRSRSNKKSILVFYGKERYDQWRFTLDELLRQQMGGGSGGGSPVGVGNPAPGAAGLSLSTRWLGRPSPYLQQPGSIPPTPGDPLPGGGNPPDGNGRKPRGGARL